MGILLPMSGCHPPRPGSPRRQMPQAAACDRRTQAMPPHDHALRFRPKRQWQTAATATPPSAKAPPIFCGGHVLRFALAAFPGRGSGPWRCQSGRCQSRRGLPLAVRQGPALQVLLRLFCQWATAARRLPPRAPLVPRQRWAAFPLWGPLSVLRLGQVLPRPIWRHLRVLPGAALQAAPFPPPAWI